jgi:hypothetical protein
MSIQKFSSFLTEAKVTMTNFDKVAEVFKRIVEKNLSTKLFRFGGPKGYTEINNGVGILYIFANKRAMRLNYRNGSIESLTFWKSFKLGKNGDFRIDLGGMGLTDAGKNLIEILKNPSTGTVKMYPELTESVFLSEAKRVAPATFAELVSQNLPASMSLNYVTWDFITNVALANDVQIPTVVRTSLKVAGTKGVNTRFDLTKLLPTSAVSPSELQNVDVEKPAKSVEPIYYLKITSQDPETKKFMSVKGDKKAEDMLKMMSSAIQNPDYKKEMKDPDSLFGIMRNLCQVVCRGARNSLIVYGGAGVGKSFVITETIKGEGLVKNKDWFIIKGKITNSALYQTLFMHREGGLLVFDDTDSVWGDQEAANILKAALDSYDERTISWVSPRTINVSKMSDEEKEEFNASVDERMAENPEDTKIKLPSEFNFKGRIIFISNLTYDKFDSAVLNRSAKIDMTLTDEQVFMRMKSILPHIGDKAVPMNVKEEILEFLRAENINGVLKSPSMRTFVAAEDLYRSGLPNWKELLEFV